MKVCFGFWMTETCLFSFKFISERILLCVINVFFRVDDLGEVAVDVNILNVGSQSQNYQIFICWCYAWHPAYINEDCPKASLIMESSITRKIAQWISSNLRGLLIAVFHYYFVCLCIVFKLTLQFYAFQFVKKKNFMQFNVIVPMQGLVRTRDGNRLSWGILLRSKSGCCSIYPQIARPIRL